METGSHELVILSYATVCLHPSVSLNNEKNCREISKDKIAVCEKTAGLRSGNSSDLDSACLKALFPVEIFQFSDMHYESRFPDTFRGHNMRPTSCYSCNDFLQKRANTKCVRNNNAFNQSLCYAYAWSNHLISCC